MATNSSGYNKKLKPLARKLRKEGTSGEAYLWANLLSRKQFHGYQFNRQFPIENYIVDFICRKLKLIIELDGRSHDFKVDEDKKRDVHLHELGYQVVRIQESEVFNDFNNVIRTLEAYLPE